MGVVICAIMGMLLIRTTAAELSEGDGLGTTLSATTSAMSHVGSPSRRTSSSANQYDHLKHRWQDVEASPSWPQADSEVLPSSLDETSMEYPPWSATMAHQPSPTVHASSQEGSVIAREPAAIPLQPMESSVMLF
eukprot:TRINITY_DN9273_c0_g1_i1.p2 TRINITY_DN9273_c0_g1~~TRINITY_DN9273_c0_g1_i1.p2  ORF type:complete len:135 (+),score=23.91 TRINITY_DN9273_c0_g1_i1:405-809(+)